MSRKFLIILVIVAFYVGFVIYSDFDKFSGHISQFQFQLLPIILITSFSGMILKGIRQQILLKKINIQISLKDCVLLYLSGLSMIMTPGGSGELIKSYFLKKKFGYNAAKTFPVIFIERFYDLLAMIVIIAITLLFIQIFEIIFVVVLVSIFLVIAYIALRSKKLFLLLITILARFKRLKKFGDSLNESYSTFQHLTTQNIFSKIFIFSIAAWSLDALTIYFVFLGFNLDLNIIFTTLTIFSSVLIGILTLVPAGIGVTEVSAVGLLSKEGISISLATSIMVMIRLVSVWFATAIGFVTTKIFLAEKKP